MKAAIIGKFGDLPIFFSARWRSTIAIWLAAFVFFCVSVPAPALALADEQTAGGQGPSSAVLLRQQGQDKTEKVEEPHGTGAENTTAARVRDTFAAVTVPRQVSRWEWEEVPRIVAMGDVHGAFHKLVSLLIGTGLVDGDLGWTGGRAHLVLCGDLVDRGTNDRGVLDLIRRLQEEAKTVGGRVHALLGNHEVMNLVRDFRSVTPEGFQAFAADELESDRREGWQRFRTATSRGGVQTSQLETAFAERYPRGYFGRVRAFGLEGEYGPWLLEQPAVVKINGVLFLHGGLTEEVAALGLEEINHRITESAREFVRAGEVLEELVAGPASFQDLYQVATTVAQAEAMGQRTPSTAAVVAAKRLLRQVYSLLFVPDGPLWYRGNSLESAEVEAPRVAKVLELLDARAIMVGHTVTESGRISTRFDGRLYRGDVGMGYGRGGLALVFEGDDALVYDPTTLALSQPLMEASQGKATPQCRRLINAQDHSFS